MRRTAQPPGGACLCNSASQRPLQSVITEVKLGSWGCACGCVNHQKVRMKVLVMQDTIRGEPAGAGVFTTAHAVTLLLCNTQSASAADRIWFLRQNPATVLCPLSLEHSLINPSTDHRRALCWVVGRGRPGQARVHTDSRVGAPGAGTGSPADKPLTWQGHPVLSFPDCQEGFGGQKGESQMCRFCISDPHNLKICCRVNGEVMQSSNTNQMVFKTEELIAWVSQ